MAAKRIIVAIALFCATQAAASWRVDEGASVLSFVTIKAGDVAEVHSINRITGTVDAAGMARIHLHLGTVDTLIPIRDDRLGEILFEVTEFPTAEVSAALDLDALEALAPGSAAAMSVAGELVLKEAKQPVTLSVQVTRLTADRVLVTSLRPAVVNARGFDLLDEIEQLRQIAGLPSISGAVPVTVSITFVRDDDG